MAQTVSVIGIDSKELRWVRTLVSLLRHPDPSIPELARQALMYLSDSAADRSLLDRVNRAHSRAQPEEMAK
jgi:hypothetical protein